MVTLKKRGFTLVELLTVVAIIALLIGILVPAVNQARKIAVKTSVRAQLSGISQGIEMFRTDFGYYPSSVPQDTTGVDSAANRSNAGSGDLIEGSHRLAFALLGRDQQGCPAKRTTITSVVSAGANGGPDSIAGAYYTSTGSFSNPATIVSEGSWGNVAQKTARKGPYIDPKGFGIVKDETLDVDTSNDYVSVLTDKYDKQAQSDITDPANYAQHSTILYYAANERGNQLYTGATYSTGNNSIYYWQDNRRILTPVSGAADLFKGGYSSSNVDPFFKFIEDEKALVGAAATGTHRPYNPETFLLISRGYDGTYGTDDDVTNWGD